MAGGSPDRRFRLLFEHAPVAMLMVPPGGVGVTANPAACALFGYTREELLGLGIADLTRPHERARQRAQREALERGDLDRLAVDRDLERRDGTGFRGRVTATAVRGLGDRYEYLLATVEDLTEALEATEAIEGSAARFRALVDSSPDIVVIVRADGTWEPNARTIEVLGFPRGYEPDEGVLAFIHPEDRERAATAIAEVFAGTRPATEPIEIRLLTAGGSDLPFECAAVDLTEDPSVGGLVITARDLSARRRAEAERRFAEQRFATAFDRAPLCISVIDLATEAIVDINPAGAAMLGRERDDLIGTSARATVHPEDVERAMAHTAAQLFDDGPPAEFRLLRSDGHVIWVQSDAAHIAWGDDEPRYAITMQADISDRKRHESRLADQATRDPLTGLLNRRGLEARFAELAGRGAAVAVLYVDLDRFKPVNDEHGHDVGDAVLRAVGRRIGAVLRDRDAAARVGGDEFVVLAADVDESAARALGARIEAAIREPVRAGGVTVEVGASIGVAAGTAGGSWDELARRADAAVYRTKRRRRRAAGARSA